MRRATLIHAKEIPLIQHFHLQKKTKLKSRKENTKIQWKNREKKKLKQNKKIEEKYDKNQIKLDTRPNETKICFSQPQLYRSVSRSCLDDFLIFLKRISWFLANANK